MIYYFSATGNTRWAAEQLAHRLGEPLQEITPELIDERLKASKHSAPNDAAKAEDSGILGFCFPVHGWRLPKIVKDFIATFPKVSGNSFSSEKLESSKSLESSPYTFVLLTCGDDCAHTMNYFRKEAEPRGIFVDAAFSLVMPESYVGLPFMDVDKKEREREKIATAEQEIPKIAELIHARTRNIYNVYEGACGWLKSKLIGGFFHNVLVTDKRFKLDVDKCTGCGKCQKVCPVANISLSSTLKNISASETPDDSSNSADNKGKRFPQWLHNGDCMTCLACYHFCPTHAIVFNRQTKKKGQYHFVYSNLIG